MLRTWCAFGWLLLWVWNAHSAALLSDSFSYTNGALVSVGGTKWSTHSGTTGEVDVASQRMFLTQVKTEDVNAILVGQPYTSAAGARLYASFNVNCTSLPTGGGNYFAHFKGGSTFRARLFATTNGATAGKFRVGVANGANSPTATASLNLSLNTDYTLVTRYTVGSAGTTLWINPVTEGDSSVSGTDTVSAVSITSFAFRQSLSSPDGMGSLFIDNVLVGTNFSDVVTNGSVSLAPIISSQPANQIVNPGATVTLLVEASGTPPINYQWQFNGANLGGETNASLIFSNVSLSRSGSYVAVVGNAAGPTNSQSATLGIVPAFVPGALTICTYNMKGNGTTNWSTNTAQVQAIGRQMAYLNPDVITFNEIPLTNTLQMTNFVKAFLPGYSLATNSGTDGYIRSVIASRHPITRSQKWLDGVSLASFGYAGNFARDLFEAQIAVPGFTQPLHVFVAHLKATTTSPEADAAKRTAEASAVSNFFTTVFLPNNAGHTYVLTGDMNEDIARPGNYTSGQPIQRLANPATDLRLVTPLNPLSSDDRTISIQEGMSTRFDYIFPCGLLFSNLVAAQVFRTDLLNPTPAALNATDSVMASDHLPVFMTFKNPYQLPFQITSITATNQMLRLTWESTTGRMYRLESSPDLNTWIPLATNLTATGTSLTFATSQISSQQFFRAFRVQ